jgi:hypothetical protein
VARGKGRRKQGKRRPRKRVETADYTDPEGNMITLRKALSPESVIKIREAPMGEARDAASLDDAWQRREEMLFERLAVRWEIAGLPIDDQKTLLGRYRMASPEERRWLRGVIARHVKTWIPGIEPPAG